MARSILKELTTRVMSYNHGSAAVPIPKSNMMMNNHHLMRRWCDVFINHRGVDTKRTVAGLLYDRLVQMKMRPFLDAKTMEPGDKMIETINGAIVHCKVGVAIFSPRYCESYFCLHELALMVENNKKIIPIFCDIKPSDLRFEDDKTCPPDEAERFRRALREVRHTVGLSYNSLDGNWSDLITDASDFIVKNMCQEGDQI